MVRGEHKVRTFTHAHRQRLERAVRHYLRKCYKENTAARSSELAMELGLTPEYLSILAKKVLGRSLHAYLHEQQVAYAVGLLRTLPPEVTNEEIALLAGFGTTSTLYRSFRAAYGTTPGAFRVLKK